MTGKHKDKINYATSATLHPVALNWPDYEKIDKQKACYELADVATTPTLLLNSYRLPDVKIYVIVIQK